MNWLNSHWIFIQPIEPPCLAKSLWSITPPPSPCHFSSGERGGAAADQQDLRRLRSDGIKVSSVERKQWGTGSRNWTNDLAQSLQRWRPNGRELAHRGAALRTGRGRDRRRLQVEPQRRGATSGCRTVRRSPGNGFSRFRDQSHAGTVTRVAAGVHKQGAEWHGRERKLDRKLFLYLSNCRFTIMQMGNCSWWY